MEWKREILLLVALMLLAMPLISAAAECEKECEGKVCVYFFYSPDCGACQSIEGFMEDFEKNYSDSIVLHRFNVDESENFNVYSNLCSIQDLKMNQRRIPLVVTKEHFLMGTSDIREKLEPSILSLIAENKTGCMEGVCQSFNETINKGDTQAVITMPLILAAAAADSINPCAIGVLIFLIGFLMLSSGKNHKRTLKIASIYIFTVYMVYFLAGIGILEFLRRVSFLKTINIVFGIGVGILGIINIKDAVQNKLQGTLAIPTSAKPLIEKWAYRASIPAAIILGIIVSSVELPCTGGVYLAILTLMANTMTKSAAIYYLAIYNLIFVLPLIILTFLFIFGFEAEYLQSWFERHKRKSRAIIGAVLVLISLVLLFLNF